MHSTTSHRHWCVCSSPSSMTKTIRREIHAPGCRAIYTDGLWFMQENWAQHNWIHTVQECLGVAVQLRINLIRNIDNRVLSLVSHVLRSHCQIPITRIETWRTKFMKRRGEFDARWLHADHKYNHCNDSVHLPKGKFPWLFHFSVFTAYCFLHPRIRKSMLCNNCISELVHEPYSYHHLHPEPSNVCLPLSSLCFSLKIWIFS